MTFDEAMKHISEGGAARRDGWDEDNRYVKIVEISFTGGNKVKTKALFFRGGAKLNWTPSQDDMSADDWKVASQ